MQTVNHRALPRCVCVPPVRRRSCSAPYARQKTQDGAALFRKGGGLVDEPDARMVRKKGKYPLRAAYWPGAEMTVNPYNGDVWFADYCRRRVGRLRKVTCVAVPT